MHGSWGFVLLWSAFLWNVAPTATLTSPSPYLRGAWVPSPSATACKASSSRSYCSRTKMEATGTLSRWGLGARSGRAKGLRSPGLSNSKSASSASSLSSSPPNQTESAAPGSSPPLASPPASDARGAAQVWRWILSSDAKVGGANDVATFMHVEYGTGIELWQGSFGWFDFLSRDEAGVVLCDSWAVQMKRNVKVFSMPNQWKALKDEVALGGGRKLEPGAPFNVGAST